MTEIVTWTAAADASRATMWLVALDGERLATLLATMHRDSAAPVRVSARSRDLIRLFDVAEICRFRAQDTYTVFWHGGQEHLCEDSLAALESRPPGTASCACIAAS